MTNNRILFLLALLALFSCQQNKQLGSETGTSKNRKAVFIILDGIPADVLEKVETPELDEIAAQGGYTRAYVGGDSGAYNQTPTISAVGYNSLLTGTWANKHNVWGNEIKAPNYHYRNIFRLAEENKPELQTAVFSTWLDNRTKLIGEGLTEAGNIQLDFSFDGFEHDTINFPHDRERKFIFNIDEHVSQKAADYIQESAPDLSWVYLEYTDDMGHIFGDSPQFYKAIELADQQVGRIWEAIKIREKKFDEEWMIVVTTDHGRTKENGKGHGGQSERERLTWIVTNVNNLNPHFASMPAVVDIMPSISRFMEIEIPVEVEEELDGVPFLGEVSIAKLKAEKEEDQIHLSWESYSEEGNATVFLSTTNHFKEGGKDHYQKIGEVPLKEKKFVLKVGDKQADVYKILLKAPGNMINTWVVENSTEINLVDQ